MPTFFSRFGEGQPGRNPRPVEELPTAIYCADLAAPVWGGARELSAERICIVTPTTFSVASIARLVLHGGSGPISVRAQGIWQRYEDGEHAILTEFRLAKPARAEGRRIHELVSRSLQEIASVLVDVPVADLDLRDALALAPAARRRRIRSGRVVRGQSEEGDHVASLFVVAEGCVSLHLAGSGPERWALGSIARGAVFGSLAVPTASVREVAVAESDSRLLEIDRCRLDRIREQQPRLALRLDAAALRAASQRYREALLAIPEHPG